MVNETSAPLSPPGIQKFTDYREFLRYFYKYKKSMRSGFSFRKFAALCQLKSPNYLQLVMNGERNLSEESAVFVAAAMKLTAHETQYFLALVRHDNAKTDEEVLLAKREGLAALKKIITKQMSQSTDGLLKHWYYLAVRELVFFKDFEPSPEYVVQALKNNISIPEAEDTLDFLMQSNYIKWNGERWLAHDPVIDSGDDIFAHPKMQKYHKEVLRFWVGHLEQMTLSQQELGLINIPINTKKIPELKKRMRQFQDEIIGWLQDEREPNTLVQLGCYLMPIAESLENKNEN